MFIKYNVLKVKDIVKQNHLKFLLKLVHRSLPNYFYHFVSATGFDVHTHNTRHRHNIRTPKIKHEFRKKCLRFSILNTFNLSPSIILDKIYTHSFAGFCQYVKKYYLAKYDSTCIIHSCFVCQKNYHPFFSPLFIYFTLKNIHLTVFKCYSYVILVCLFLFVCLCHFYCRTDNNYIFIFTTMF